MTCAPAPFPINVYIDSWKKFRSKTLSFVGLNSSGSEYLVTSLISPKGQVREVTQGSHDITANRDMRDALGIQTEIL